VHVWNGVGKYKFIGGSCQNITCAAGYIETTLGGSSATQASLNVSGGTVKISEVIGNLNAVWMNITSGEAHVYRMNHTSAGVLREVNGGTLYLYDVDLNSYVSGPNAFVPIVKLTSGNLYLRGRISLVNTVGNPGEPNSPTTLTQTNKSNIVLWTGGNLFLDGCTLITQDQNDLPILSRTPGQVLKITSNGCATNRTELGGLLAAKKEKVLVTVANVTYPTINQTISTGATSANFSINTAGKTTTQAATDLCAAINAGTVPVTAIDNNNGTYYLEADTAGDPFTYTLYNQPFTMGQISLSSVIIRDNSYEMTNPTRGLIIDSASLDGGGSTTFNNKLDKNIPLNRQTSSYVLVAEDNGKLIEMNVGTANTLTIDANIFSQGSQFLVSQYGTGQTTITAGSGVTLRSNGNKYKTSGQYALITIIAISATEFYIAGDLIA